MTSNQALARARRKRASRARRQTPKAGIRTAVSPQIIDRTPPTVDRDAAPTWLVPQQLPWLNVG